MFSVQLSQPINLRNLKIVSNTFQSGACNNLSFIMKTMDHLTYNTVCEEEKAMMLQIQYTSWFFFNISFYNCCFRDNIDITNNAIESAHTDGIEDNSG